MNTVSEITEMANTSMVEVDSTANVEQAGNGASDTVDTRCLGYASWGHLLTPSVSTLCCLLSGRQGHARSAWIATPSLDNTSIVPFRAMACKAEVKSHSIDERRDTQWLEAPWRRLY